MSLRSLSELPFQLLFLPVTLYLVYTSLKTLPKSRRVPEVSLSKKSTSLGFISFLFAIFLTRGVLTISQKTPETTITPTPQAKDESIVIRPSSASPTPLVPATPTSFPKTLTITHPDPLGEVNIRTSPTTSSELIQKVPRGSTFTYIQIKNNWYEIQLTDSTTGWVKGDYVTINH